MVWVPRFAEVKTEFPIGDVVLTAGGACVCAARPDTGIA